MTFQLAGRTSDRCGCSVWVAFTPGRGQIADVADRIPIVTCSVCARRFRKDFQMLTPGVNEFLVSRIYKTILSLNAQSLGPSLRID